MVHWEHLVGVGAEWAVLPCTVSRSCIACHILLCQYVCLANKLLSLLCIAFSQYPGALHIDCLGIFCRVLGLYIFCLLD